LTYFALVNFGERKKNWVPNHTKLTFMVIPKGTVANLSYLTASNSVALRLLSNYKSHWIGMYQVT